METLDLVRLRSSSPGPRADSSLSTDEILLSKDKTIACVVLPICP